MDQRSQRDRRSGLTPPANRGTVAFGSQRGRCHATHRKHGDHRSVVARRAQRVRSQRRRSEGHAEGTRHRHVVDPHGEAEAGRVPRPDQGLDVQRVRPVQRQGLVLLADRLLRRRRRRLRRVHVRRPERGARRATVLLGEVHEPRPPLQGVRPRRRDQDVGRLRVALGGSEDDQDDPLARRRAGCTGPSTGRPTRAGTRRSPAPLREPRGPASPAPTPTGCP